MFPLWSTRHLHRSFSTVSFPRLLSTSLFYFLVLTASVLSTGLFCSLLLTPLLDLPSLVLFRSRRRSHAQALCVGFVPKQTKKSSDWHLPTPTEMNATHRVTKLSISFFVHFRFWLLYCKLKSVGHRQWGMLHYDAMLFSRNLEPLWCTFGIYARSLA